VNFMLGAKQNSSDTKGMNKLPLETRVQILSMLCEGSSMRSVSRIQHSLKNHEGKGVEIVGEARPARWRLAGT
jgi:hypothetical protein